MTVSTLSTPGMSDLCQREFQVGQVGHQLPAEHFESQAKPYTNHAYLPSA